MPPEDVTPETTPKGSPEADASKELQSKLAERDAKLEALSKENEQIKGYFQQVVGRLQQIAASDDGRGNSEGAEGSKSFADRFGDDPEGALGEFFEKRIGPLVNQYWANSDKTSREIAGQKLSQQGWDKYRDEVEKFMQGMPADVRANPENWESAFKYVRSKHVDEEVEERVRAKLDAEKRASLEASSPPGPKAPEKKVLSDVEKKVAEGLGVSEKDYLEMQTKMRPGSAKGELRVDFDG